VPLQVVPVQLFAVKPELQVQPLVPQVLLSGHQPPLLQLTMLKAALEPQPSLSAHCQLGAVQVTPLPHFDPLQFTAV
jgi:hypothetical protein